MRLSVCLFVLSATCVNLRSVFLVNNLNSCLLRIFFILYLCRVSATQQRAWETRGSQWLVTYRCRCYSNAVVVSTLIQYALPTPTSASFRQGSLRRHTRCPLPTTAVFLAHRKNTRCCLTARVCHVMTPDQYSGSVNLTVLWVFIFSYIYLFPVVYTILFLCCSFPLLDKIGAVIMEDKSNYQCTVISTLL